MSAAGAEAIVGKVGVKVVPLTDDFRRTLERQLRDQLGGLGDKIGKQIGGELADALGGQLGKGLGNNLGKSLGDSMGKSLGQSMSSRLKKAIRTAKRDTDRAMRLGMGKTPSAKPKTIPMNIGTQTTSDAEKKLKALNSQVKVLQKSLSKATELRDKLISDGPRKAASKSIAEHLDLTGKVNTKDFDKVAKILEMIGDPGQGNYLSKGILDRLLNPGDLNKLDKVNSSIEKIKNNLSETGAKRSALAKGIDDAYNVADQNRRKYLERVARRRASYNNYLEKQARRQAIANAAKTAITKGGSAAFSGIGKAGRGIGRGAGSYINRNIGQFPGVTQAIGGELLINKMVHIGKEATNLRKKFVQLGMAISSSFAAGALGAGALFRVMGGIIGYGPGLLLLGAGIKAALADEQVSAATSRLGDVFTAQSKPLVQPLTNLFDNLSNSLEDTGVLEKFYTKAGRGVDSLAVAVDKVVRSDSFGKLMDKWGDRTERFLDKTAEKLPGFIDGWNKVDDKLFTAPKGGKSAMERIKDAIGRGNGISADGINAGIERFTQALERAAPGIQSFRKNFGTMFSEFKNQLDDMASTVGEVGPRLFDSIGQIGTQAISTGGEILNSAIRAADTALSTSRNSITEFISTTGTSVANAMQTLAPVLGNVLDRVSQLGTQTIGPAIDLAAQSLANLEGAVDGVFDVVSGAASGIQNSGLGEAIDNLTTKFGQEIGPALSNAAPGVEKFAKAVGDLAAKAIDTVADNLGKLGSAIEVLGTVLGGLGTVIDTLNKIGESANSVDSSDGLGMRMWKNLLSLGGHGDAEIAAAAEREQEKIDAGKRKQFPSGGTVAAIPGEEPESSRPKAAEGFWVDDGTGNLEWHDSNGKAVPKDKWPAPPGAATQTPGQQAAENLGNTLGIENPNKIEDSHTAESSQQINTVTEEDIANAQTFQGLMTQINELGGKFNEIRGQLEQSVTNINQTLGTMQTTMGTASTAVTDFGAKMQNAGANMSGLNIPLSMIQGTMANFATKAQEAGTAAQQIGEKASGAVGGVNSLKEAIAGVKPPENWGAITQAFDNIGTHAGNAAGQVQNLANQINSLPDSKTITINVQQNGSVPNVGGGNAMGGWPIQAFAGGGLFTKTGWVRGRGTTTSDSVNARLSRKEFVVRASSARKLGAPMLNYLNRFGALPGYADGGEVDKKKKNYVSTSVDGSPQALKDAETSGIGEAVSESPSDSGGGQDTGQKFAQIGIDFLKANVDQFLTDIGWKGNGVLGTLYEKAWESASGGGQSGGGGSSTQKSKKTDGNGDTVIYNTTDLPGAQRADERRKRRKQLQYTYR